MLIESENWIAKTIFQGFLFVESVYELSDANNVAYQSKYDCTRLFNNIFQIWNKRILIFFLKIRWFSPEIVN